MAAQLEAAETALAESQGYALWLESKMTPEQLKDAGCQLEQTQEEDWVTEEEAEADETKGSVQEEQGEEEAEAEDQSEKAPDAKGAQADWMAATAAATDFWQNAKVHFNAQDKPEKSAATGFQFGGSSPS